MKRILWILGLAIAAGPIFGTDQVRAADADTSAADGSLTAPNAALLLRLSRARDLASRPRTFQTQTSVTVAARRHADELQRQRETLDILNNQYLRGTDSTAPSEPDIRRTIGVLEQQLSTPTPPENAYEIKYYLAACYETLGNSSKALELLRGIVSEYQNSDDEIVQSFVQQSQADIARIGS